MWTKTLPREKGWYWYRVDTERYPGLPDELTEPQMMYLTHDPATGHVMAHDPAEAFCEFDAAKMHGYWSGPLVAPDFAQADSTPRNVVSGQRSLPEVTA